VGKTSYFQAKCVIVSKIVRYTYKVTINDYLHALSIDTKIDDLELLYIRISREFRGISQIWEAATAKRMIDLYCQRQRC